MKDTSLNVMNGLNMIVSTIVNSCMREATKTQCINAVFQNTNIILSSDDTEQMNKDTYTGGGLCKG